MRKSAAKNILFLSVSLISIFSGIIFAQPKKDVTDPVLQEILVFFKNRMPRFIDQHGQNVFVADGPVTRGGFLSALYEYDRSLRYASKQDVNEIKEKITQMDTGKYDINKIALDIQPIMPSILDKSLNGSKVFSEVKAGVTRKQSGEPQQETLNKTLSMNIAELNKRVERVENSLSKSKIAPGDEIIKLENRIIALENKTAGGAKQEPSIKPVPQSSVSDIAKRIDNLELLVSQNVPAQKAIFNLENKVSSLEKSMSTDKLATNMGFADLSKKIDKIEIAASDEKDIRKSVSDIEQKINLLSGNGVITQTDFLGLERRISEIEKTKLSADSSVRQPLSDTKFEELFKRVDRLELAVSRKDLSVLEQRLENLEKSTAGGYSGQELSILGRRLEKLESVQKQNALSDSDIVKLERRLDSLEKQSQSQAGSYDINEISKKLDKIDSIINENKLMEGKLARFENRLNNISAAGAVLGQDNPVNGQDVYELNKRLEKVERIVPIYSGFEKEISKLEEKINSVERMSSLGNLTSSEEVAELSKKISELERQIAELSKSKR